MQCRMTWFASIITTDVTIISDNTLVCVFHICKLGQYLYFGGCGRQFLCIRLSSSRSNLGESTACRFSVCWPGFSCCMIITGGLSSERALDLKRPCFLFFFPFFLWRGVFPSICPKSEISGKSLCFIIGSKWSLKKKDRRYSRRLFIFSKALMYLPGNLNVLIIHC